MGLREDAKKLIEESLGSLVARQLDSFDNPEKYPNDFLDEVVYFLGKFIGEEVAKKKLEPLYRKYAAGGGKKK